MIDVFGRIVLILLLKTVSSRGNSRSTLCSSTVTSCQRWSARQGASAEGAGRKGSSREGEGWARNSAVKEVCGSSSSAWK
jgi:hypothetical protein